MNITFDTNVLLSATLWDGSVAQKLLFHLIKQDAKIYSTSEIILEYQTILKRDFDFSELETLEILGMIFEFIILVKPTLKIDIVKADPDDNKIIECAIESNSRYIITYDKHLLNLKEYKGISIIRPDDAKRIL